MKIIVTGSAGFIGYHLTKSLLEDNYEVYGIDSINNYYDINLKKQRLERLASYDKFSFKKLDISDKEALSNAFTEFKPQKVVNLAAQAGVRYSLKNPYSYLDANLSGFLNIIELCRYSEIENLVYASSSSVYGGNTDIPFKEDHKINKPLSLYGATKAANELIAYSYSNLYSLNATGLRFFTVYGPWGRPDMALYIFTKNIISGAPIKVFNNGKMMRDFTFIDDIVHGIRSSIDKNYKYEIFNLGNNKSEKLMDMISYLENAIGKKAIIDFLPIQPGDVIKTFADIEKSKKMLDYSPRTDLKKGINKFVDWYLNNNSTT